MAAATAGLCCCLSSPPPQTFESTAARWASAQRGGASLTASISASPPSSGRGLTQKQLFSPRWALSNVEPMAPRSTNCGKGDGGRPKRMVAEVDEQNGGPSSPPKQQERGPFPRPPVVLWEKDFANAVQLIGRVGKNIEIKYLDSGKVVATTSLAVHNGSQTTDDPSWFTLEIWDDLAEIAAHHVAKGALILVAGKIGVGKTEKDDVRYSVVKVVVRDLCLVEPSSDPRQPHGTSNDEFTIRGSSSQSRAKVASMNLSQRNWNQQQLSSQPSQAALGGFQGTRGHANNVAQLEAQSSQTGAGASKRWEAAKMIDSVRQDLRTEELLSGRSTPASMKAGLNVIVQGRSQSRASYSNRNWSRDTAIGNGSTHMRSASTTSQSIAVLQNRLQRGITTAPHEYVEVLKICLKQKDLVAAKQVHDCIIQSGMDNNLYVAGTLLNLYIKCGAFVDARRVFDQLEKKSVVAWTNMIGGYAESDRAESALELFNQMRHEGVMPNEITYLNVLKACTSLLAVKWGKEIQECIRHAGFESDVRVGTALLNMYAKCGCIMEARQVFENLANRDVITWTAMIGGLAQHGCGHEAYRLFCQMKEEGFEPDAFTYVSILNASASAGPLAWVKEVHGYASKAGLESDVRVGVALVHMYAESGNIDDARRVFDRMKKRDVVTWNVMIGGLAHNGCGHEALALFRKMDADLVKPDRTTFVALLSACCHGGLLDDGHRLFLAMTQDYGIDPDIVHYNCMVDLLGRAGHLDEAKLFISDMPVAPNEVTWKALLGACRTYGNVELGELAAKEVFKLEPNDASAYVLLSNIYAAAGKWKKRALVRTMMLERGVRKEPGRTWIEVDNKIHEFVVGDTSHPEGKAIYTELNKLTEKLKAEGYIPDTRLVLHDINEEDKELALCSHSEKLAIAYGLMHIPPGEPIRVRKNLRVCPDCHTATKLISKVTGREIIARDANRFHRFKDGVCSCGDYW